MSRPASLCLPVFAFGCTLLLTSCSTGVLPAAAPTSSGTNATATVTPPPLLPATQKNMYVVQAGHNPISTLVFPLPAAAGSSPAYEIPGSQVAVDGTGNIYVLDQEPYPTFTVHSINVYSAASPTGKPIRSLPVGPGTKLAYAWTLAVSKEGEIYVWDGTGIAVFDATATGDADPVRYIQGVAASEEVEGPERISALYMAVDDAGNLYIGGNSYDWPILVYGPKATGPVAPTRAIRGSQTGMGSACHGYAMVGMAVNDKQDIYVLYVCAASPPEMPPITLYKFGAGASGDVAPDKSLRLQGPHFATGLALDSAGNIYFNTGDAVLEYVAGASGDALIPSYKFTSPMLSRMPPPPGMDDWGDASGTIVLH